MAGINYYKNLLKELKDNNIEPLITLYHWDLPQKLQDLGGWTNPLIVEWFADYAKICFELFGNSVKYWITFNEPMQFCGESPVPEGLYLCGHHVIKSHAKAWHIYNDMYRSSQKGNVLKV